MKIVVAISGGLDSAAAVLLLKSMGFDNIEALFIDMHGNCDLIEKAKLVASQVGVKLHIEYCAERFKNEVVGYFFNELQNGATPSLCAFCNPNFKFKILAEFAEKLGCDKIATGHYAQIEDFNGKLYIKQGVDKVKDQSYFLWGLSQEVVGKLIFPLGGMVKSDVKKLLSKNGYKEIAEKKESMSLCFLEKNISYNDFIKSTLSVKSGDVIDENGNVIGEHNGYQLYTIGQKKGFNVFSEHKNYEVTATDPKNNQITVSNNHNNLYIKSFQISQTNFIDEKIVLSAPNLTVKVRGLGRNPQGFCRLEKNGDTITVHLQNPAWAIAKGQSAVFYIDNLVVGGGIIL